MDVILMGRLGEEESFLVIVDLLPWKVAGRPIKKAFANLINNVGGIALTLRDQFPGKCA